jgi:hypothetical protein
MSTALATVITAIATALLATVISVLVQIAIYKCHPKFTPGGAVTGTAEEQKHEEVEDVNNPMYMEIGEAIFQPKENGAYKEKEIEE